jgi:hypothetical protein
MSRPEKKHRRRWQLLNLDDRELLDLLEDLRARALLEEMADAESIESAIAELEVEASCRGLNLPATCHEPTPQPLALRILWTALERGDQESAARAMTHLDAGALWFAYRRTREHGAQKTRLFFLVHVLFCLDALVFSEQRALERGAWLSSSDLSVEDRVAYLEQCINALFGGLLAYGPPEPPSVE